MPIILRVCLPNTKRDYFFYHTFDINLKRGMRVKVTFRKKLLIGVIVGFETHTNIKTLEIEEVIDENPIIPEELLNLLQWVSQYYQDCLSQILTFALPKNIRLGIPCKPKNNKIDWQKSTALELNNEQMQAYKKIKAHLANYNCFVLQGVTGSGKTEVYMHCIAEVLKKNKQVLVMVPEIGLTPQLLERFQLRFSSVKALHSNVNDNLRAQIWLEATEGKIQIVIGTRTAVFTPFANLGLIIIDEEHDLSFKQMERFRYCARDTAIVRAKNLNIPIILGSATPSLETLQNAINKKYTLLHLRQRANVALPPIYELIDLRTITLEESFAATTLHEIKTHVENNKQVLIFINRRGYAPIFLCHDCAYIESCKNCASHLTYHQNVNELICHHCGYTKKMPRNCSSCKKKSLILLGFGTQRIEQFLKSKFAHYKILRVDRDEVKKKNDWVNHLNAIKNNEAQIIIGTQMLAKGHHFPALSLVVILDADYGFFAQDFRAEERFGQLLLQVGGRAGRETERGKILIQTHLVQNKKLQCLLKDGYEKFAEILLTERRAAKLPPFSYLALLRASGKNQMQVFAILNQIKVFFDNLKIENLGPAPSPLQKKANYYNWQLLLKETSRKKLQMTLLQFRAWAEVNLKNNISLTIDVDPRDLS